MVEALNILKIPSKLFEIEEEEDQEELQEIEIPIFSMLRKVPLGFTMTLGITFLLASSLQVLIPTVFNRDISIVFIFGGFLFVVLSLVILWLQRNPEKRLVLLPPTENEPNGLNIDKNSVENEKMEAEEAEEEEDISQIEN